MTGVKGMFGINYSNIYTAQAPELSSRDFVFFLKGYLEGKAKLDAGETALVKEKLQKSFEKKTPTYTGGAGASIAPLAISC